MLSMEWRGLLVSSFVNWLVWSRLCEHPPIRFLFTPSLLALLLKLFTPQFFNAHRSIIVPAMLISYTLYVNYSTTYWLETAATAHQMRLGTYILSIPGIPCVWLGTFTIMNNTKAHLAALTVAFALWRHRTTFIPDSWPLALRIGTQCSFFAIGVLLPAAIQHTIREAKAQQKAKSPAPPEAAVEAPAGGSKAPGPSRRPYKASFTPLALRPPPGDPTGPTGCTGATGGRGGATFKLLGLPGSDIASIPAEQLRSQIKKSVEAKLGHEVVLRLDIREGCLLVRLGCFTQNEDGDGWTETAEGLPTVDELCELLPEKLRGRITAAAASDPSSSAPSLLVSSPDSALPFPSALLDHGNLSLTVPINLSLTARWVGPEVALEEAGGDAGDAESDATPSTPALPSPSSICSSFAPVCWIGRRLDKLQVQGDPEWGLETDAEGNIVATCSFTVLVEPRSDGGIEPSIPITHLIAGLEAKPAPLDSTGAAAAAAPAAPAPPTLLVLPLIPAACLTELSALPDESRLDLLNDLGHILDLRASGPPTDAAMSDTIQGVCDRMSAFAAEAELPRLGAVLAWLRAAPRRDGAARSDSPYSGALFRSLTVRTAAGPAVFHKPAPSSIVRFFMLMPYYLGLRFYDPTLETAYRHERTRVARRRNIKISIIRVLMTVLIGIMDYAGTDSRFWATVAATAAADQGLARLLLSREEWLHKNVPLIMLELLGAVQAAAVVLILGKSLLPMVCGHATAMHMQVRLWLRMDLAEVGLLVVSCGRPLGALLSCAAVTLNCHYHYFRCPQCLALGSDSVFTPNQIVAFSVGITALSGLIVGCAVDRWQRRSFRIRGQARLARDSVLSKGESEPGSSADGAASPAPGPSGAGTDARARRETRPSLLMGSLSRAVAWSLGGEAAARRRLAGRRVMGGSFDLW